MGSLSYALDVMFFVGGIIVFGIPLAMALFQLAVLAVVSVFHLLYKVLTLGRR